MSAAPHLRPRPTRKGRPLVTDAAVAGLRALYGPDLVGPPTAGPGLSATDARAILRRLRTVHEAWAHYCMQEAFHLQQAVNAYCEAASTAPTWPAPARVLPAPSPVTDVTLTPPKESERIKA